ncbi:hypothetical protein ZIOFF_041800 [Zingiber officinale]|uniref:C3H1-type domain-containing protein n=1 Tax=Zingiber officinale TaxID=94328 RepID=A0A8J5G942_ZINOF|nr:hypothetical protein ZIOFF_041800 [Zingiber officinale]
MSNCSLASLLDRSFASSLVQSFARPLARSTALSLARSTTRSVNRPLGTSPDQSLTRQFARSLYQFAPLATCIAFSPGRSLCPSGRFAQTKAHSLGRFTHPTSLCTWLASNSLDRLLARLTYPADLSPDQSLSSLARVCVLLSECTRAFQELKDKANTLHLQRQNQNQQVFCRSTSCQDLQPSDQSCKVASDEYGTTDNPDKDAGGIQAGALFQFDSSKEIQVQHDSRATASLETETEFSKDARAIRERVLKRAEEGLKGKSKPGGGGDEKVYKGIHGYTDYKAGFRREQTVAGEKAGGAHGPLRASAHIRLSARFDYQPDICKDYKETGYCGYGDSCKFMHDRGDYKSGWQLEKEWDEAEKARKKRLAGSRSGSDQMAVWNFSCDSSVNHAIKMAETLCHLPYVLPLLKKFSHFKSSHLVLVHSSMSQKKFLRKWQTLSIFSTLSWLLTRVELEKKIQGD